MSAADAILYIFCATIVLAALQDLAQLRISNIFPVMLVMLFGIWLAVVGIEKDLWENALLFALSLAIGTFLFSRGWLGGGDVKLLAAIMLWFDLSGGLALVVYVAIGGGVLALAFIIARRMIPAPRNGGTRPPALRPRGPIPYGLAIAAGTLLCVAWHAPNPAPPAAPVKVAQRV